MANYPTPGIAPPVFYDLEACPIRNGGTLVMQKWPTLVICHLSFGAHRFSELSGGIPDISQRMLIKTLRNLEDAGMISRHVTASVPPRVDYDLTDLGRTMLPSLQSLLQWSAGHRKAIESHQKRSANRT